MPFALFRDIPKNYASITRSASREREADEAKAKSKGIGVKERLGRRA